MDWISVEDRWPETSHLVLAGFTAQHGGGVSPVTRRWHPDGRRSWFGWGDDSKALPDNAITHWMPLPAPPTEDE